MLHIHSAQVVGPTHLDLRFSNGTHKVVDVVLLLEGDVFTPLRDPYEFAKMELDTVCGTVTWPNGADFAPEALHELPECKTPATAVAVPTGSR